MFLYICGEYTCKPPEEFGRDFPATLSKEHKGLLYVLEHRYYGKSQPFNTWENWALHYLTVDNALADMAAFLSEIKANLTASSTNKVKIITIGGSYPGALSAWFRYKYPHIADGALASSAVVNAVENLFEYDGQVYTSMLRSGE